MVGFFLFVVECCIKAHCLGDVFDFFVVPDAAGDAEAFVFGKLSYDAAYWLAGGGYPDGFSLLGGLQSCGMTTRLFFLAYPLLQHNSLA